MARENAISEFRNVTIIFNGEGVPLDAYKAAIDVVTRLEGEYNKLGASRVPDMIDQDVRVIGSLPFKRYLFKFTIVMNDGVYGLAYEGLE